GTRRAVVALDAGTGELLWMHSENEGKRGDSSPRPLSGRGLAYWSDGRESRILYITKGYRLVALDAKTGVLVATFGKNGIVDLKLDDDQDMDLVTGEIGVNSTPIVAKNVVIVGAGHLSGAVPKSKRNEKGYVRGFDVKTGKRLWIFHTIPQPGEFGNDTWEKDSWAYTGNTGVWGQMSVDEELGLVYLPVEMATGDYYGGHRPGSGLFGESLVAVDLQTGKRKWHYQLIHHGMWDWDLPCAPILADLIVDGKPVKVAAQPTKQGWLYTFNRETGQPIWPIEERPVPKGDVPGEWYSPTQPHVTKPPAYERQGVTVDDLIDFTPELKAEGLKLVQKYKMGPIFTPPVLSKWEGPLATLGAPGAGGGSNWAGGAFDPETKMLYVYSRSGIGSYNVLATEPGQSDMAYVNGQAQNPEKAPKKPNPNAAPGRLGDPDDESHGAPSAPLIVRGLPLGKPPYGRITAFDMNKGDLVWQIAHGETADAIRNNPALKGATIPRTGRPGVIGTLVTKTLVIAGEAGVFTTPNGQRGAMLRAYDKATGVELGAVYMPAGQTGSPMTYMLNGKQYLVVAVGGGNYSGELLAFKLPS
ncbi:MAG: PQQ-binding-like beta-propeller repeat protein, partial [Acidobacteriota bacterium]